MFALHAHHRVVPCWRGYLLTEIAIALAIAALLLTAALPSFHAMLYRAALRSVAEQLRSDLTEARALARERRQFVYVSFQRSSDGQYWCWGLSVTADCDCRVSDPSDAHLCAVQRRADDDMPLPRRVVSADYQGRVRLDALPFSGLLRLSPVRADLIAGSASFSTTRTPTEVLRVLASRQGRVRLCSPSGAQAVVGVAAC